MIPNEDMSVINLVKVLPGRRQSDEAFAPNITDIFGISKSEISQI